eukprot:scaffold53501_cov69-Phaeocystis_antarctica.AAC.3
MVRALPMALPGGGTPVGCRTLGYGRGGDTAPRKRSRPAGAGTKGSTVRGTAIVQAGSAGAIRPCQGRARST